MDDSSKLVVRQVLRVILYAFVPIIGSIVFFNQPLFNFLWQHKSLIFVFGAAFFNAVMDSIENDHILSTRFATLKDTFWRKTLSWQYAKRIFKFPVDGWHLSKSAMIICWVFAILLYTPMLGFWQDLIIFGYWYNSNFNWIYQYALTKKP